MSQSTELHVPDGYYPPFAVVTDTDHGAYIIIAASLGITFVVVSSLIRLLLRITFGNSQRAGLDDTFLAAATVLAIVQTCMILGACSLGLGRSIDLISEDAVESIQKLYYASNIFYTLSLGLSRCCVLIFILRLTPIESHRRVAYGIIIATALWVFGAVISSVLQCDPSQPWRLVGQQQCNDFWIRLRVVCIIDAILEAALVACTAFMVRPLKTPLSNKFVVVFVFSFRLPIILIIAFRLHVFHHAGLTMNFTFDETLYIALTQTQVCYSLISATVPNLRPIINNLNTHYGAMGESTLTGSNYNSNSNNSNSNSTNRTTGIQRSSRRNSHRSSIGNVFAMGPLKRFKSKAKDSAHNGSGHRGEELDDMPALETVPSIGTQAVETGSSVRVQGGNSSVVREAREGIIPELIDFEGASLASVESRPMTIRKDVDIQVHRDGR